MKQKITLHLIAGYGFAIYSLIEIIDCGTALLMAFNVIDNPYPEMYFEPMNHIFNEHPGYLIPLFMGITTLRIFAAIGLLTNKSWKTPMALSIVGITLILMPFMLPFSVFDFLICSVLIVLILIGNKSK